MKLCAHAPAKINLFLDVGPADLSGYHSICSIMQTVSLYDTITMETNAQQDITLRCPGSDLPCDNKNLAYRAAQAFWDAGNVKNPGISITIDKQIPVASGLAGGSTDAGAVLLLLNALFDMPLSGEALLQIGGKLGADIPFCMTGETALCSGIGDKLSPLPAMEPTSVVIARGGADVSTAAAYAMLDKKYGKQLPERPHMWEKFSKEGFIYSSNNGYYNIFESVILPYHKEAAAYKTLLENAGARIAMMSGSGPAVFGLFDDDSTAQAAVTRLKQSGANAYLCKTCGGVQIY